MKATSARRLRVVALAGLLLAASTAAYDVPGMRDAMHVVFANMRVLLELSADTRNLRDPANREAIHSATTELADQAALISSHAPRDELSYLAGSLDRYATWIRRSYEWHHFDAMRGQIHDTVDLCVACHTRLPSRGDSPVAEDFLQGHDMDSLTGRDRARLQVATRRFDDALATLEATLAREPAAGDFFQTLGTYLVVALRVKGNPARARGTLESVKQKPGVTSLRREQLDDLIASLQRLESSPPAAGDLKAARALVDDAEARNGATSPVGLVNYVAASRLIYQFLETGRGSVNEGAEAYYLLGLTRYRLDRDSWLPQAELFLEKAIRTAPGSEHSNRALTLLESQLRQRLGKGGQPLPDEVVQYMKMLREMNGSGD